MFATVTIEAITGSTEKIIAVPEKAVLMEGEQRYVFLPEGMGRFLRRNVAVGRTFGDQVEITAGLKEGDLVVTSGSFLLKSELKKGELSEE